MSTPFELPIKSSLIGKEFMKFSSENAKNHSSLSKKTGFTSHTDAMSIYKSEKNLFPGVLSNSFALINDKIYKEFPNNIGILVTSSKCPQFHNFHPHFSKDEEKERIFPVLKSEKRNFPIISEIFKHPGRSSTLEYESKKSQGTRAFLDYCFNSKPLSTKSINDQSEKLKCGGFEKEKKQKTMDPTQEYQSSCYHLDSHQKNNIFCSKQDENDSVFNCLPSLSQSSPDIFFNFYNFNVINIENKFINSFNCPNFWTEKNQSEFYSENLFNLDENKIGDSNQLIKKQIKQIKKNKNKNKNYKN